MMSLRDTGDGLVIAYPFWIGLLALACGIALAIFVARKFECKVKTFTTLAAAGIGLWGGAYFLSFRATLAPDGARVYAFMRYSGAVDWRQVAGVVLEPRPGKGNPMYVVMRGTNFEINVTDLNSAERERVLAFSQARLGRK